MSASHYVSHELNKIDKRRTFGLLGFLFILAFFPVIFSSSSNTQQTRTEAATLPTQSNQSVNLPTNKLTQQTQFSATQATPAGNLTPTTQASTASNLTPTSQPVQTNTEEAYSPQPSIWLFIVPIAVTFFTILFY